MEISMKCGCGATFNIVGGDTNILGQAREWRDKHKDCPALKYQTEAVNLLNDGLNEMCDRLRKRCEDLGGSVLPPKEPLLSDAKAEG